MPKKTLNKINKLGGYYVVGLKRNQKLLLNYVKELTTSDDYFKKKTITDEKSRGRHEIRRYYLFANPNQEIAENWGGLCYIIKVERTVITGGKTHEEISYYITNKQAKIEEFARIIRGHWLIENSLHYVKDVVFKEDKHKFKYKSQASIMSILIHIAINILRTQKEPSITRLIRHLQYDLTKSIQLCIK